MITALQRRWLPGALCGLATGGLHAGLLAALGGSMSPIRRGGAELSAVHALAVLLFFGLLEGVAFAFLVDPRRSALREGVASGIVFGLLCWLLVGLGLLPALLGDGARLDIAAAAQAFSGFVSYSLQGGLLGLAWVAIGRRLAPESEGDAEEAGGDAASAVSPVRTRIVLLGGGFAGVTAAEHLEHLAEDDPTVGITLISTTNHLLFTPMLSEVSAGSIEGPHISTPLRNFFRRARVIDGEVESVDLAQKSVRASVGRSGQTTEIPYDHLVFALGAVPNFFGMQGVAAHAFTFKSLEDALHIRNHVIDLLERADAEPDAATRREMLSVVVAGGGFAGVELIGGLNDFIRGSLPFYPHIDRDDVSLTLIHSGDRILQELSPTLGLYAKAKLEERGVRFLLKARVTDATADRVLLKDSQAIPTRTFVWTAGNVPHPILRQSGAPVDDRGRIRTEPTMAVPGHPGVWAVGDAAAIPDVYQPDKTHPPTAQHALREARQLAINIHAALRGHPLRPFRFRTLGAFAVLGHQTACAEIRGRRFSGPLAWFLWRTIYLSKLPGLEKKIRVALDWTVDLFFPRDLVQTITPSRDRQSALTATATTTAIPGPGPGPDPAQKKEILA